MMVPWPACAGGPSPLFTCGAMSSAVPPESVQVDVIEEFKLRRWARENYVPPTQRDGTWHPIILEEMTSKDRDSTTTTLAS